MKRLIKRHSRLSRLPTLCSLPNDRFFTKVREFEVLMIAHFQEQQHKVHVSLPIQQTSFSVDTLKINLNSS